MIPRFILKRKRDVRNKKKVEKSIRQFALLNRISLVPSVRERVPLFLSLSFSLSLSKNLFLQLITKQRVSRSIKPSKACYSNYHKNKSLFRGR